MEQNTTQLFNELFASYLSLRLSAFENLKIVVGVLAANDLDCEAFELNKQPTTSGNAQSIYAVKWQDQWILCGRSNGYQEQIVLSTDNHLLDTDNGRVMNVPVLSLQQISFMCVETAHFDHC
ncbi:MULTISPECIES: hypothetical protein [unclassified Shewanella]|uniref:hypothetical protein n=1 Tax=unclassified Shewanella TaxID=196818 RepID=UPI000C866429|nr:MULTISPECIES: hypothetical protein [unclassified Shewanella]MDO6617901.1 hypothetical protein [Shewanella sp. 6_MG-2023]MDO6639974.1 hypothetical protein [Shewanella sp. 5_MG-2023]MDO6678319.1 hypothetical protein [Shewanella sp. 4_MG-2023]PMG28162.1 hypothetical protein BCU94_03945 [Shewanella sp. 10N.286.52.C2]PMG48990.1 hypothetical protein BCU91_18625 [Shewanella sp. 10N.286.52.B9]